MLVPSVGALISFAVMLLCLAFAGLLAIEGYLLSTHRAPITSYTRNAVLRWPGPAIGLGGAVVFVVGLLAAHFGWDASCT